MPVSCSRCGRTINQDTDPAVGCGAAEGNHRICYLCCAEDDRKAMRRGEPMALYLRKQERLPGRTDTQGIYTVGNWPGTLQIPVYSAKTSSGWARGHRYPIVTFTFLFEGQRWYGRCAGDMDLARCKPYKHDPRK